MHIAKKRTPHAQQRLHRNEKDRILASPSLVRNTPISRRHHVNRSGDPFTPKHVHRRT